MRKIFILQTVAFLWMQLACTSFLTYKFSCPPLQDSDEQDEYEDPQIYEVTAEYFIVSRSKSDAIDTCLNSLEFSSTPDMCYAMQLSEEGY